MDSNIPPADYPGQIAWVVLSPMDDTVQRICNLPRMEIEQVSAARIVWRRTVNEWLKFRADDSKVFWAVKGPGAYGVSGVTVRAHREGYTPVNVENMSLQGLVRMAQVVQLGISRSLNDILTNAAAIVASE